MRFLFVVLVVLLIPTAGISQNYKPIDTADYHLRKAFLQSYVAQNDIFLKGIKKRYTGGKKDYIFKIYEEFGKGFEQDVKDKNYTFTTDFDKYCAQLVAELRKKNPEIPDNLRILIAKSNYPNAYCFGDGTFVVNMGLFTILENKQQIIAVLAHEIGHHLQEHVMKAIVLKYDINEQNKANVSEIKANSFNKTDRAFDVLKKQLYSQSIKKRKQEVEADSIGYVLYSRTDFQKSEYVNALKNLAEFDSIPSLELKQETYKTVFNLPNQPFKENWLKMDDFSAFNYNFYKEKIDKDSLATHPEMSQRILMLKKSFPEIKTDKLAEKSDLDFDKLQYIAQMEVLNNYVQEEKYGHAIYTCLLMIQQNHFPEYFKKGLGDLFQKAYDARKSYKLNRYIDQVDPKNQDKNYQQFLSFLWNLKLDEIKNIADFYKEKSP